MKKLIICLFTTMFLNQTVFANDLKEIELSINEDKTMAIKIFESLENIDFTKVVFEDFEKDNFKYTKDNVKVEEITKEDKKEQIETLELILSKSDFDKLDNTKILQLFQDNLPYEKDEYKGILLKENSTLKVEPNKTESNTTYKTQTITLNEKKTYYGLESNDYGLIPKTIVKNGVTLNLVDANFVSTNNEAISSVANTGVSTLYNCNTVYKLIPKTIVKNGVTLNLVDANFVSTNNEAISSVANTGVSTLYNCNTVYKGSYNKKIPNTKTKILDYKVTVQYKGEISKEIFEKNLITVTYKGEKISDLTVPIAVATGTGATGIFGFIVFWFTKKNVKVYNLINGAYELIGKCKIKNNSINLTTISLKATSNIYKLQLDKNIAKKLNNQDISITLVNSTKIKKFDFNEENTYIDVVF